MDPMTTNPDSAMANAALKSLIDAVAFAAQKHRDQRRKDHHSSPYINHPIALAHVLAFEANVTDQVVLVAAVLHDTIEDTGTTAAELAERFGAEVAAIVEEVTDDKSLSSERRKLLQIEHAPHLSSRGAAGQAGGQDLQPARRGAQPAEGLEPRAPARVFRLGQVGDRRLARTASGHGGAVRCRLRGAPMITADKEQKP